MSYLFRQLFDNETSTYTYLVASHETQECALVDPVSSQIERDLELINELGLKLIYSIETHIHADHISAGHLLRKQTQCQLVVPAPAALACADILIHDKEELTLGNVTITAINTPGHTDAHCAYLLNSDKVLTGDALFIRGCGRTDFQSGDAGTLYDSITTRLFTLDDNTLVYPGHNYKGLSVSTINEEKQHNPRLAGRTREQFIELMNSLNLPEPKNLHIAGPANMQCGQLSE